MLIFTSRNKRYTTSQRGCRNCTQHGGEDPALVVRLAVRWLAELKVGDSILNRGHQQSWRGVALLTCTIVHEEGILSCRHPVSRCGCTLGNLRVGKFSAVLPSSVTHSRRCFVMLNPQSTTNLVTVPTIIRAGQALNFLQQNLS